MGEESLLSEPPPLGEDSTHSGEPSFGRRTSPLHTHMGKSSRKESLPKGSASRAKGPVKATHKRFKDTSTDKSKDKPSGSSEDESDDAAEDSSKKGTARSAEVTPAAAANKTTSKLPAKEGSEVKSAAGGERDAGKNWKVLDPNPRRIAIVSDYIGMSYSWVYGEVL